VEAGVDSWVRGLPEASDHAPAWVTLKLDAPIAAQKKPARSRQPAKPRPKRTRKPA
jgi:exodeoxyribonuclease-3